eukprot:CAMPEP_0114977970 /NCGR_PEP_ID=MMETSP0216-20121206/3543_1 /TAXON_ID=223996 /ORGANISM="Protocruzia adherens, Strain Boccale" /LENGTH=617 /DNA_ID=CAMNT_0002339107 /DNA_START=308 /DNA_END=2161 /DNA_ORIENTATION=-
MWIFDELDGSGRLLKHREGHSEAPNKVRFYGNDARNILSSSEDGTFRDFSLLHEDQNLEMSYKKMAKPIKRGNPNLQLPPISDFAFSTYRDRDWDNVISCHRRHRFPYLWSRENHVISQTPLQVGRDVSGVTSAVAVSLCGNFGVVATDKGQIHKFNMQSGLHRGLFGGNDRSQCHSAIITGLEVDALNKYLISISYDKTLKQWDFYTRKLLQTVETPYRMELMVMHKENYMIAIANEYHQIEIYDARTLRKVRHFDAHEQRITDLSFSPDAKWLISASLDKSLKIWDLAASSLVEWVTFKKPVVSFDISPKGDMLATAHAGSRGIFFWTNRFMFESMVIRKTPATGVLMKMPEASEVRGHHTRDVMYAEPETEVIDIEALKKQLTQERGQDQDDIDNIEMLDHTDQQISEDLRTLSDAPKSKAKILYNLDVIKSRNKPVDLNKKEVELPFFLPSLTSDAKGFDFFTGGADAAKSEEKNSKTKDDKTISFKDWHSKLETLFAQKNHTDITDYLKSLPPSKIDLEFRQLQSVVGQNEQALEDALHYFIEALKFNSNFELIQAFISSFLKIYGETLIKNKRYSENLDELNRVQQEQWNKFEDMFMKNGFLIGHLSNIQL